MSGDLIDTTEMYLKTVFELEEEGIPPMRARIAERLDHSGPTVSQTVARMERDGLLHLNDQRQLEFTEEGRRIATEVMRKHRLAERLLIDTIGLDFALAHTEACRWEHVISKEVEEKLAALIDGPFVDPYGNAIPGLAELGIAEDSAALTAPDGYERVRLSDHLVKVKNSKAPNLQSGSLLLLQIGEPLQIDIDLLDEFAEAGLVPGAKVEVKAQNGLVKLTGETGASVHLNEEDATHLVVGVAL